MGNASLKVPKDPGQSSIGSLVNVTQNLDLGFQQAQLILMHMLLHITPTLELFKFQAMNINQIK